MKICSRCGREFPATAEFFAPSKLCRNGISGWCVACKATYSQAWKAAHRERISARRRELYAGRYGEQSRRREIERERRAPIVYRAGVLRCGMLERSRAGVPMDRAFFTKARIAEMLLSTPLCPCCRTRLSMERKHDKQKHDDSPSVDRIVPVLGYVPGNVAILCWRCNNLKRDATPDELEAVARWMRAQAVVWGLEAAGESAA